MVDDMVNSPAHYNAGSIECIDAIREALGPDGFNAYCRGNAIKYNWRAGHKFNSLEDLKKAAWYSRMAAGDDPRQDVRTQPAEVATTNLPYTKLTYTIPIETPVGTVNIYKDTQVIPTYTKEVEPSEFATKVLKRQCNV